MDSVDARILRGINLNLLPVLRELLRQRSVTAAAQHLNVTQSAVSEALGRLRVQFGDDLLVRVGRRMVPTAFALEIAPRLADALAITQTLFMPSDVNLKANERVIRIASGGDTLAVALGKGLIERLMRQAPRTTVQFVNFPRSMRTALDGGSIDFLILPRGMIPNSVFSEDGLDRMTLFRVDTVCIARRDHPDIGETLSLDNLNTLPTVACRVDEMSHLYGALPGRQRVNQIQVPQFLPLPLIVAESDAIAMVQRHIADAFAKILPLRVLDLPIPFPTTEVCAYWSAFQRNDPLHIWMRQQLAEVVEEARGAWLPRD